MIRRGRHLDSAPVGIAAVACWGLSAESSPASAGVALRPGARGLRGRCPQCGMLEGEVELPRGGCGHVSHVIGIEAIIVSETSIFGHVGRAALLPRPPAGGAEPGHPIRAR